MFIAPMNAPGVKLLCRASYEMMASAIGTPFDYPLSSRFDENDAIFVFDNVLVPWEDVLLHRDVEKLRTFFPQSGLLQGYQLQGCTRLAVKLDFLVCIIAKALRVAGSDGFRGNQAMLGEIIAWLARRRCSSARSCALKTIADSNAIVAGTRPDNRDPQMKRRRAADHTELAMSAARGLFPDNREGQPT